MYSEWHPAVLFLFPGNISKAFVIQRITAGYTEGEGRIRLAVNDLYRSLKAQLSNLIGSAGAWTSGNKYFRQYMICIIFFSEIEDDILQHTLGIAQPHLTCGGSDTRRTFFKGIAGTIP